MACDYTDETDTNSAIISGANEWDVPDWLDGEYYLSLQNWDIDRWRWEFLRRRPEYRAAFKTALGGKTDPLARPPDMTADDALNFAGMRAWSFPHRSAQLYGLSEFYDPRVSDFLGIGPMWNSGIALGGFDRVEFLADADGHFEEVAAEHMVAITFDLRRPLAPQIEEAQQELEVDQSLLNISTLEAAQLAYGAEYSGVEEIPLEIIQEKLDRRPRAPNNRPLNWPKYLRVLDAREAGASWGSVAQIL